MKTLQILLLLICIHACTNNDEGANSINNYNAKVLQPSPDCNGSYLIELLPNTNQIPTNNTNNTFVEINLPDAYKIPNLNLSIEFRLPNASEHLNCTTQDIAYPEIVIVEVIEVHN